MMDKDYKAWWRVGFVVLCQGVLLISLLATFSSVRATPGSVAAVKQDVITSEGNSAVDFQVNQPSRSPGPELLSHPTAISRRAPSALATSASDDFNVIWDSGGSHYGNLTMGDVNGDGHLDLIASAIESVGFRKRLYIGNGDGTFSQTYIGSPLGDDMSSNGAGYEYSLADMDGDGDLDLMAGAGGGHTKVKLFENYGGVFQTQEGGQISTIPMDTGYPSWGDVDGDGDPDILGIHNSELRIYRNDGESIFNEATPTSLANVGNVSSTIWGDLDGDNDLDILVAGTTTNTVYRNDGGLVFTEVAAGDFTDYSEGTPDSMRLGDMEGDGDLDLLYVYDGNTQANTVFENDGDGIFTDITAGDLAADVNYYGYTGSWADYDQDGDLDILISNAHFLTFHANQIYRNDGGGIFTDVSQGDLTTVVQPTDVALWGDVDGDGDLDVVTVDYAGPVRVFRNNRGYAFTNTVTISAMIGTAEPIQVAWGDVDGDFDLDVVAGGGSDTRAIYHNQNGAFTESLVGGLPADPDTSCAVAFGDIDGDGDLDLFTSGDSNNKVYRNDGASGFTEQTIGELAADSVLCDAVWGDVDQDGDLDLLGVAGNQPTLYQNDGAGGFNKAAVSELTHVDNDTADVALGDIDGDNDLDIIVVNDGQNRAYRNDGQLSFTEITAGDLLSDGDNSQTAELGDVDGDGDLDLFVGNSGQASKIYRNDGSGLFVDITGGDLAGSVDIISSAAWGDVDGDADLDLALGVAGGTSKIYRNDDGTGLFSDMTGGQLALDSHTAAEVALGDADGDGDLDLLVGTTDTIKIYINRQHIDMPVQTDIDRVGVRIDSVQGAPAVNGYGVADKITDLTVPISYTLWDNHDGRVGHVEAWFSPNGGGAWFPGRGRNTHNHTRFGGISLADRNQLCLLLGHLCQRLFRTI